MSHLRYIYDVFYKDGRVYIISAAEAAALNIYLLPPIFETIPEEDKQKRLDDYSIQPFYLTSCPEHQTYIYHIETPDCSNVQLYINNYFK